MKIITNTPYLLIFGQDLVYWTGMIGGVLFLILIISAIIKKFNLKIWKNHQIMATKYHHWLGWITLAILLIHTILAIIQFNFHIFL